AACGAAGRAACAAACRAACGTTRRPAIAARVSAWVGRWAATRQRGEHDEAAESKHGAESLAGYAPAADSLLHQVHRRDVDAFQLERLTCLDGDAEAAVQRVGVDDAQLMHSVVE